jgi:phosphatidylglycerol:prolipoprotein diacylglycerol transferase
MKYFYWSCAFILTAVLVLFVFVPMFAGTMPVPSQINLGKFAIRIYGIIMGLSILVGYFIARKYSWKFGISQNEIDDIAFWITIAGVLGARIYYVLFNLQFYTPDYAEIYKIWHGGLSIYGAVIGGLIFILVYARKRAYSVFQLLDLVALALPLGQALGRLGNFFNQEAFGTPTNLPWKMFVDPINRPDNFRMDSFFHPAFLYEILASVIIYFILVKFFLGRARPGVLAFVYLGLYAIARFFIESIRLDSSYLYGIKIDQLTSIVLLLVAGIMVCIRQGLFARKN